MATIKTTTYVGNYAVDTFTGVGTISWTVPTNVTHANIYVVGSGGGAGSAFYIHGSTTWYGFSGAVVELLNQAVSGSYTITIGSAGANGSPWWNDDWGYMTSPGSAGNTCSMGALAVAAGGAAGPTDAIHSVGVNGSKYDVTLNNTGCGGYCSPQPSDTPRVPSEGTVIIQYLNPTVTLGITKITTTSAVLGGEITELLGGTASRRGFCYISGTSTPTTSNTVTYDDGTFSTGTFTKTVTSLNVAGTYTFRAYMVIGTTTYYSAKNTITTLSLTADVLDITGESLVGWTDGDTGVGVSSSAGNFEATALWQDSAGAGIGNFSIAPNGQVAYCNGVDSVIWGGDEVDVRAFITSTAAIGNDGIVTNPILLTSQMQNNKTDADNVAHIGGGVDSSVVLMLHGDGVDGSTTIVDSSTTTPKTVTAVAGAQLDTAQMKFGISSILFDGTGDYLTVPDSTDWYFADQPFTIDTWVRFNDFSSPPYQGICGQHVDDNNFWYLRFDSVSATENILRFVIVSGGVTKASYFTQSLEVNGNPIPTFSINTWYHIELVRTGTNVYIFINGGNRALTTITAISTNEVPNLAAVLEIGAVFNHATVMNGWLDEFRISKGIARHTASFTPMTIPYRTSAAVMLVGATRPLSGVKPYVLIGNTVISETSGRVWTGTSWLTLTLTDNTDTGPSLSQTGTITFASTVGTAVARYIEGYFAYWYQFTLSDGGADLYQFTVTAPMQPVMNIWDGVLRSISAYYQTTEAGIRTDESVNVYRYEYDALNTLTYSDISSLPANHYLEIAFTEKVTALGLYTATGYHNTGAGVTAIGYWSGGAYASVGSVSDGTAISGMPMAQNGFLSWNNATISGEQQRSLEGGDLLYFYKISFSGALSAGTRLFYVAGIPAADTKSGFAFPLHAADRLMLGCDTTGRKNKLLISAQDSPDVFNGADSYEILVGDDSALTCGTSIFAQYASNIYNMALIFKATETWTLVWTQGTDATAWTRFKISPNVGCPAPRTLRTVSAGFEHNINNVKVIAIWRAEDGIYVSNGQAPYLVSSDISDVFDQTKFGHVCQTMIDKENSFVDHHYLEYHWCYATDMYEVLYATGLNAPTLGTTVRGNTSGATGTVDHLGTVTGSWGSTASGTLYLKDVIGSFQQGEVIYYSTTPIATLTTASSLSAPINNTLDKELVLDMIQWKWYNVDRDTGNRLQVGIDVSDLYGNSYTYGFVESGYMERLEYGISFDGTAISWEIETGDQLHVKDDLFMKTSLTRINAVAVAKNIDSGITFTHTMDGAQSSNDYQLSVASSNRYANVIADVFSTPGMFHSYKFSGSSSSETKGFEPLVFASYYKKVRDHIN